ncbi:hypothetical protein MHTCC0001_36170 [Flavobacteriaceae bacterium MHTCC 0001]
MAPPVYPHHSPQARRPPRQGAEEENWSTDYHFFRKWQKEGVWEKIVQAQARQDREREGRCP